MARRYGESGVANMKNNDRSWTKRNDETKRKVLLLCFYAFHLRVWRSFHSSNRAATNRSCTCRTEKKINEKEAATSWSRRNEVCTLPEWSSWFQHSCCSILSVFVFCALRPSSRVVCAQNWIKKCIWQTRDRRLCIVFCSSVFSWWLSDLFNCSFCQIVLLTEQFIFCFVFSFAFFNGLASVHSGALCGLHRPHHNHLLI